MMMAAEVSAAAQVLSRRKEQEGEGKRRDLVTMDLLGGCGGDGNGGIGSKDLDLDLDLKVPVGWEKRLDLVSGDVFFQRRINNSKQRPNSDRRCAQDPSFTPISTSPFHLPRPNLDLKLFSSSPSSDYQSVCTLDNVKFALQQVSKKSKSIVSQSPTSSATTTSSVGQKRRQEGPENDEDCESKSSPGDDGVTGLTAAGCSSCLSYVLVSKEDPRCPRCQSPVPLFATKKPRIGLNSYKTSVQL